jgi:hypothetical protein
VGIAKGWRHLRALKAIVHAANESASGSQGSSRPAQGMVAGLANVMADALAPLMAATAEQRGGPLPGSDPAVLNGSAWSQPVAAQAAKLQARDAAFDLRLLTRFAEQVVAAVVAVWTGADAGTVRPVMSDALWEPLAGATMMGGRPDAPLGQQRPAAHLAGLHTGTWYDSAQIIVHVTLSGPLPAGMPVEMTEWDEDWLFQRSIRPGGDPMIRPQSCPACGAPARTGDQDLCPNCRAPVPYLTTGWLVTQIVSHHPAYALA